MSTEKKFVAAGFLVIAFASGVALSRSIDRQNTAVADVGSDTATATPQSRADRGAAPLTGLPDLSPVAERAIQASVNISSTQQVAVDRFFQIFYGADPTMAQTSLGSGVLVEDGYILTNSHVVGDARSDIRVTFSDNQELPAKIIGVDPDSDLAVVRVDARKGTPLPWGDSNRLKAAEWVLAVGNPFSFNQAVTLGVVSAPNRHSTQLNPYTDFIQTDAAINPGNSGGALVNARGELVGINTLIYSETGGYQGIGFAIPTNVARPIMTELIKTGEVVRGSIGNLSFITISAAQARDNDLGDRGGVVVMRMFTQDPAARAGMRPRDLIVSFNGQTVTEQGQFARMLSDARIGSTAKVEVLRAGRPMTFNVEIVRRTPPAPPRLRR
jgi:S1-C subfamily serine protease